MILVRTIDIDAPPERVWSVTEDIGRWADWSPTVVSITRIDSGPFQIGSSARIKQPGLPEAIWTVTDLVRGRRFTWETRIWGMRMAGTHIVESAEGGTRSTLRLEIRGFVGRLASPLLRSAVGRSLERENAGLKARCERQA